jgi:hypothetical protein
MRNQRFVRTMAPLLDFAAAVAVVAIPGRAVADTPPGWDSWPEAQPFRVALRVAGFFTLVFLVLVFIALRVARTLTTHKHQTRPRD